MPRRPTGTVTFLFTDIEGSTRLWERRPDAMRAALARHDALLRQAIEAHGGHVFKTVGDAFYAAFTTAPAAVQAAVAAQHGFHREAEGVKVRMALHTGEAEARDSDYFGPALNRVARLLAAGHGGQVLLSQATAQILRPALPAATGLRRLGSHRLRDLATTETIYQLLPPGLPSEFPPLNTLDVAFRRGLLRATGIAAVIVAVMVGLALLAMNQAHRANHVSRLEARQRHRAEEQQRLAEQRERTAQRYLYAAQVRLAQQNWTDGNLGSALELLDAWRPEPGQEDLRGFEWRYLWRLCQEGDARSTFPVCKEGVAAVAFSPNGKVLAAAGGDATVRLWDVATKRQVASLRGHTAWVETVAFAPDGKTLASSGMDHTIRLWDVSRRRALGTLQGHKADVYFLAFSPDGKSLVSTGGDDRLKLWDVASQRALVTVTLQALGGGVAFSPDGRTIALAMGNDLKLWDVASRRKLATLTGHEDGVRCAAFSPDGRLLASGGVDKTVKLWDVVTRRPLGTIWGSQEWIQAVSFSPDGKTLATGSSDGSVRLWSVASRRPVATFNGHHKTVLSVVFSPDGKTLASSSLDGTVRLWDATPHAKTPPLGQETSASTISFSPDLRTMAMGSDEGAVTVWDIAARRRVASLKGHKGAIRQLVFSPDGKILATGSDDKTLKLWEVGSRKALATFHRFKSALTDWLGYPGSIAFPPDGRALAMASTDGTVKLWYGGPRWASRSSGPEPRLLAAFPALGSVAFSPDGKTLAIKEGGDNLTLWDVASHRKLAPLNGAAGWNHGVQFSPDGRILATGGYESVRLWNMATRRVIASLKGPSASQYAWFSPDGKTLVTTKANTLRLWNIASAQEVAILGGFTAPVIAAAFSADGNTLVTASRDGRVRRWRAASLPEADPLQTVASCGSDRAVLLQWRPLLSAAGYNVYRGPVSATPDQLVKLTTQPVSGAFFTDHSPGLVNGRTQAYAVAAVFSIAGRIVEGPRAVLQGTPVTALPGFMGCSIDEGARSGSTDFDAASGQIRLRGSGSDIYDAADQFYFLCHPVTGDFQVTVRALTRPGSAFASGVVSGDPTQEWAKAGLMARESLEAGARNVHLCITRAHGIQCNWRPTTNDTTGTPPVAQAPKLKLPLLLRLTRRGDTIAAEYSRENGQSFQTAGRPFPFEPPLAKTLYVGLAITSHDPSQISEAKFSGLRIERR